MSNLMDALIDYATESGVTVILNCPVTAMKDDGQTITATYTGNLQPAPKIVCGCLQLHYTSLSPTHGYMGPESFT